MGEGSLVVVYRSIEKKPAAERIGPTLITYTAEGSRSEIFGATRRCALVPRCAPLSIGHGLSRASHGTKRIIINLRRDETENRMAARSYS